MTTTQFTGIFPALVTPLTPDGAVNASALEKLLERVYSAGVDGVYVCGSTGEGMLLPESSRQLVAEVCARNTPAGKHLIVHVGAATLASAERLARHACSVHASAISCIRPPGITHEEMLSWFDALVAASSLPFFAYYFPAAAGEPLSIEQLFGICEKPGVSGIKFTDYDLYSLSLLTRSGYTIFNGRDEVLAAGLLMGASGGIGSIYNLVPGLFVDIYRAALTADWPTARAVQDRINDLIRILVRFPFLPALKQLLTWEGIPCGNAVTPAAPLSADQTSCFRQEIGALGLFSSVR
jgi:N-acetylneuraminate lyase